MKNIELNAGGFIGAIAVGVITGLLLYLGNVIAGDPAKLVVIGVIAGAFLGNFVWSRHFVQQEPGVDQSLADDGHPSHFSRTRAEQFDENSSGGSVWLTIAAVVFLIGGIATEYFTVGLFLKAREVPKWPTVAGTITRSELKAEFGNSPEALIEFDYQIAETRHQGKKVRARGNTDKQRTNVVKLVEKYPVGTEVLAFVNPADPKEAFLEGGVEFVDYIMIVSPLVFAICAGVYLTQTMWAGRNRLKG